MRTATIAIWMLVTFGLSIVAFEIVLTHSLSIAEPWHQRVIDSNIEYALALFFVLFVALGHGLSAAYIEKPNFVAKLYRALILPIGLGLAQLSFFPIALVPNSALDPAAVGVITVWLLVSGVVGARIGRRIAGGLWFREKILIGRGSRRGMGGAFGFRMYNAGLVTIFVAGFLTR